MIKTQIQLEDWQYSSLKRAGAEAGRSMSDVIRESVSLFKDQKKRRARFTRSACREILLTDRRGLEVT
jgi:predicted CopG family antitoxin